METSQVDIDDLRSVSVFGLGWFVGEVVVVATKMAIEVGRCLVTGRRLVVMGGTFFWTTIVRSPP